MEKPSSQPLLERSPEELLAWAEEQAWVKPLRHTPQDQRYHAEGDVWTHTKLVCDRLRGIEDWRRLREAEQRVLFLAAVFHDIGKPIATERRGRYIISPNHAPYGRRLTRSVLIREPIDYKQRELVVSLVRWHTTPPTITKRAHPNRTVIDTSWRAPSRLLVLLATADGLGRDSMEQEEFLGRVEEYQRLCIELNCYEQPYPFANDQARFLWFRNSLSDPDARPPEDFVCEVTMLSGLPGAGKDYWYRHHAAHLPMMSLDGIRKELGIGWTDNQGPVLRAAEDRFIEFLSNHTSFVYNATNIDRAMRRKWVRIARHRNARIRMVYIEPPLGVIQRQNRAREDVVDEDVIDRYIEKLEPPEVTEAHEVVWV